MEEKKNNTRIRLAITQGDINGVGYEVILKTFSDSRMYDICTPILYGSTKVASYHKKLLAMHQDMTFNGTYDINTWTATYYIDNEKVSAVTFEYGATITYPSITPPEYTTDTCLRRPEERRRRRPRHRSHQQEKHPVRGLRFPRPY